MRCHGILIRRQLLLCLLCIVRLSHCLPSYGENAAEHRHWHKNDDILLHQMQEGPRNYSVNGHPLKPNETDRACVVSANVQGRCEHFRNCFLKENYSISPFLLNHKCTIDRTYVGVCCPNKADGIHENFLNEENLANILPAIIADDHDDDVKSTDESSVADGASKIVVPQGGEDFSDDATRNPRRSRGCGTTTNSKTRLVGGRPADPSEWPWMAALLKQNSNQYCGGVLITDRHVLTAAHCVYKYKPRDIRVRLGEYDFTTSHESRAQDFAVSEIRVHRDFDYTSYDNDIAIVKIHRPTIFNSYIWPICLPPIEQNFENKSGIVTGWGTQYYGGPASTVLMEVAVPIWPQFKCVRSFVQRISRTTLCAGAFEGGRDACQGDSGGPLLHQLGNGRWVNIGIVSWGIRCGEPGHPGIYTRVNAYLDWIFANAVF